MGREIRCMATIDDWVGDGRLLLETDDLIFRGARRLSIPLKQIRSVRDESGWLVVDHDHGSARFDLGALTPSWVNAIANPRTRADKLGVKPASRIAFAGVLADDLLEELRARTATVSPLDASGSPYDMIFLPLDTPQDLERLPELWARIPPAGAIWVLHPKGDRSLAHEVIVAAARAAGLIDNKSARISDTHAGLRLVIPRQQR